MVWPSRGALPATKFRGAERHRTPTGNNRSSSQRLEENGGGSGECRRSTGVARRTLSATKSDVCRVSAQRKRRQSSRKWWISKNQLNVPIQPLHSRPIYRIIRQTFIRST